MGQKTHPKGLRLEVNKIGLPIGFQRRMPMLLIWLKILN